MVAFGVVSLLADMVYEGMRSVAGPLLGVLGASALVVGIVTGLGEAAALVLRLVSGTWADRSGLHWRLTVLGYGLTAVCVPLLAITPALGAAGLAVASALILAERVGKAVRSPAKSALLADVAAHGSLGRAFGVHKALDQIGAFAGPLVVAGVVALAGPLWSGLAVLAVPGALAMVVLAVIGARVPAVSGPRPPTGPGGDGAPRRGVAAVLGLDLPAGFQLLSLGAALTTAGLLTFGVISWRFVDTGIVALAAAPLVYGLAMAAAGVTALAAGAAYDRIGARVLLAAPLLVALVPPLALADHLAPVLLGAALWGAATGVLDATIKAEVAAVVPRERRATGYGVIAAVQGVGAVVGGVLAGWLVTDHRTALAIVVAVGQAAAIVLLVRARAAGVSRGR